MKTDESIRFFRFCVVGVSNFIVGLIVFNSAYLLLHRFLISNALAYVLAVLNGFLWNRSWTFHDKRGTSGWIQLVKFASVNTVGWLINTTVTVSLVTLATSVHAKTSFPTHAVAVLTNILCGQGTEHYSLWLLNGAGIVATCIVLFWNFIGHRSWSFRH